MNIGRLSETSDIFFELATTIIRPSLVFPADTLCIVLFDLKIYHLIINSTPSLNCMIPLIRYSQKYFDGIRKSYRVTHNRRKK